MYGNIQPRVLMENKHLLGADGLLQRFIPGLLDPSKSGKPNLSMPSCLTYAPQWESALRLIATLPAQTYTLSPAAHATFDAFTSWYWQNSRDERITGTTDEYMTAYGKLEGTALRFALVLHVLTSPYASEVSDDTMRAAVRFIRSYVIPAIRYLYSEIAGLTEGSIELWMIKHIVQISDNLTVTLRDLKRSAKRPLELIPVGQHNDAILNAVQPLVDMGWLIQTDERKTGATWAINPTIQHAEATYRRQVIDAKQRILDGIHEAATAKGYDSPRKIARGNTG
jgi:hypothetical protein